MVLCKFFQQGTCRFGSKCHNEHFDVKQVLKTDVESAVNGKQWPLSSYGPFKDKPSIPNFIEDQSFEEVRLLCYEAKQKNFFEQFHQQFTKEAMEASNKMKALLQMTPEILDVVINCYDAPGPESGGGTVAKPNNPFGMAASSAGSIFAKPSTTAPAGSIFGGGTQGNFGNIANSGGGMFGGASSNAQSSNIFGSSSAFGQTQQQSSIFGQTAQPTNSIFGGSTNSQQQATSIFGQQQQQQQQQQPAPTMGGNLFAQPAQQSSAGFGLFSQQQPPQQASLFSQPQQGTNIFGQTSQTQPTQNIFEQTAGQQPPQQGLFAQAAAAIQTQQQPSQGMFDQAANQQQSFQQQTGTIAGQGLFAQAAQQTQNIFSQSMPQQQVPTNIFQQSQTNPNQQLGQEQPPSAPTGIFKQAALQIQNAGGLNTSGMAPTLYSRMDDLTAEEIEAFKADCFQPGKLPHNPPPRELVN